MLLNEHSRIVQLLKVAILHESAFAKHFSPFSYLLVPAVVTLDSNRRLHLLRSLPPLLRVHTRFVLTESVLYHFSRLVELALLAICECIALKSDTPLEPPPLLFGIGMLLRTLESLRLFTTSEPTGTTHPSAVSSGQLAASLLVHLPDNVDLTIHCS